ncbi:putative E3 ubiquitin-protein ligase rbrA [Bienertia sinuspersici]
MISSSLSPSFYTSSLQIPPTFQHSTKFQSSSTTTPLSNLHSQTLSSSNHVHLHPPSSGFPLLRLHKYCLPLALSFLLSSSNPAQAGFLSGLSGIESVPGPELPSIEFLQKFNEENQKKYAENDERFKSSPIVKELLERSKKNKEKNKREILDKYCLRGAEWGVGDCSTEGMTVEERDNFIAMLKEKVAAANK